MAWKIACRAQAIILRKISALLRRSLLALYNYCATLARQELALKRLVWRRDAKVVRAFLSALSTSATARRLAYAGEAVIKVQWSRDLLSSSLEALTGLVASAAAVAAETENSLHAVLRAGVTLLQVHSKRVRGLVLLLRLLAESEDHVPLSALLLQVLQVYLMSMINLILKPWQQTMDQDLVFCTALRVKLL